MQMREERVHVSELPRAVHDEVSESLKHFTVGITRVHRRDRRETSEFVGSGTLAIVNGQPCILTADHVLAELASCDRVGLISDFDGGLRRIAYDLPHVQVRRLARGQVDAEGPDLGAIILPEANLGALKATKTFYNIDARRERFAADYVDTTRGAWFNMGVIEEGSRTLPAEGQFAEITGFFGMCGVSACPTVSHHNGLEYLESRVPYEVRTPDIPESFGGLSGGGFWQVLLHSDVQGTIHMTEPILSGVTFYQSAIEKSVRRLRSHGRDAIYRIIPELLQTPVSS